MQATQVPLCVVVGFSVDVQGAIYIPDLRYGALLKVAADGTIRRIAGSAVSRSLGDGGSPLSAILATGGYSSPAAPAIDASGGIWIPGQGMNRIRRIVPEIALAVSRSEVGWQGTQSDAVQVTANVGEPLPFAVRIQTDDGGAWLSADRVTGLTGDSVVLRGDAAGLEAGVYRGTVSMRRNESVANVRVTMMVR
jgi:hypothetical protein